MTDESTDISPPSEDFVGLLTSCQGKLYGYILSLLPDPHQAKDILQETNLVIWRKAGEFEAGSDFGAWISRIAFFQVMAHRSRHQRDRHLYSEELIAVLAKETEISEATDQRSLALHHCLSQLPEKSRDLLWQRYSLGSSAEDIAQRLGKKSSALRVMLFRIRKALLDCIQRQLGKEATS